MEDLADHLGSCGMGGGEGKGQQGGESELKQA